MLFLLDIFGTMNHQNLHFPFPNRINLRFISLSNFSSVHFSDLILPEFPITFLIYNKNNLIFFYLVVKIYSSNPPCASTSLSASDDIFVYIFISKRRECTKVLMTLGKKILGRLCSFCSETVSPKTTFLPCMRRGM